MDQEKGRGQHQRGGRQSILQGKGDDCVENVAYNGSTVPCKETFSIIQIAHFKIPRYVLFVDSFPTTVTGKIQKFKMREESIKKLNLKA